MTRTLPNAPLWPRFGRSGQQRRGARRRRASTAPGHRRLRRRAGRRRLVAAPEPDRAGQPSRAPARPSASAAPASLVERAQPLHPGQEPPLAIVEPVLDVGREDVAAAGGPDAERDRDRVVGLVGDRDRDPGHPELLARGRAARPWRRTAGWPVGSRSISMSRQPMPRTPSPRTLLTGLLRRPAPGERLGPVADVALLGRRSGRGFENRAPNLLDAPPGSGRP